MTSILHCKFYNNNNNNNNKNSINKKQELYRVTITNAYIRIHTIQIHHSHT